MLPESQQLDPQPQLLGQPEKHRGAPVQAGAIHAQKQKRDDLKLVKGAYEHQAQLFCNSQSIRALSMRERARQLVRVCAHARYCKRTCVPIFASPVL